ncbi:glutamate/gamma-aminobutyrate family transporter YjeM [Aduncisulcus paluster]|uniref:Glutamate/gamma-aminobutyrate family transporter YjeM n=1 Tax=Aduncisulcus paluster TaxID=2918883 RepID=A0ABQ5KD73_9EUKA|nr:glutamate/gamma-aminobutyrate family transporter YjeM [Aduncisulcus paluster]
MWVQGITVCVMIGMVSFGGDAAADFFAKLVLMTNVAMTLPYMFISGAFIGFKKKTEIEKPFVVFKNTKFAVFATVVVTLTVGFANLFTIIEPAMNGDILSTLYSIAGPLFFTLVAIVLYGNYERKAKAAGEEKRKLQKA